MDRDARQEVIRRAYAKQITPPPDGRDQEGFHELERRGNQGGAAELAGMELIGIFAAVAASRRWVVARWRVLATMSG
jgi:hypothetical protein